MAFASYVEYTEPLMLVFYQTSLTSFNIRPPEVPHESELLQSALPLGRKRVTPYPVAPGGWSCRADEHLCRYYPNLMVGSSRWWSGRALRRAERPCPAPSRTCGVVSVVVALLSIPTLAAPLLPSSPEVVGDLVVAVARGEELTCTEFSQRIQWLPLEVRRRREGERDVDWRGRMAAELLVESALAREAVAAGLDRQPEFVSSWTASREALLVSEMERGFAEAVEAAPGEIEAFYEGHRERYRVEERIATRFILLNLSPEPTALELAAVAARLEGIRAEFLANGGFGQLARQHSEAENARRGGAVQASARGTLLAEYEEVAWRLQPGEVSGPVRLPDGMAIIWLEERFPAKEITLAEAGAGIAEALAETHRLRRREAALAEARALWPAQVEWAKQNREPTLVFAGRRLSLGDLGLGHRPPRLDEAIVEATERLWLARLGERRLADNPALSLRLSALRRFRLAGAALDARVDGLLPSLGDEDLRATYEKRAKVLGRPELRSFEALRVDGTDGTMRAARAVALDVAQRWRRDSEPPEGLARESWGPLPRAVLGNRTSPRLAEVAFRLELGGVSEPIRFERYRGQAGRFQSEGYVVLRLVDAAPPETPPFEEVKDRLPRLAAGRLLPELRTRARARIREDLAPELFTEALRSCATEVGEGTSSQQTPAE